MNRLPFAAIAALVLTIPAPCFARSKPQDVWNVYFKQGLRPEYPLSAKLLLRPSKDRQYTYTDSNGRDYTNHCSRNLSGGIDCASGTGDGWYLADEEGRAYYIARSPWNFGDPWLLAPESDSLSKLTPVNGEFAETVHYRLASSISNPGVTLACVQYPGSELIPEGKELKQYAKHHRMESCYQTNRDTPISVSVLLK